MMGKSPILGQIIILVFSINRETLNNLTQRYSEELEKQVLSARQDLENQLIQAEKV